MITVKYNSAKFMKEMDNMVNYTLGFIQGVKQGYPSFLRQLGASIIEALKQYIDSNARVNPQALHHIYEWNQIGSPDARLFDLQYNVTGTGLSFSSTFKQSNSIKDGSKVPFYDKAKIMENGIPVTIVPKNKVLVFEEDGQEIFVSKPITVQNPGGNVQGEYERVFDSFFNRYFTQAFLQSTGITTYLSNPQDFYASFPAAKRGGRSLGVRVGRQWITKAGAL